MDAFQQETLPLVKRVQKWLSPDVTWTTLVRLPVTWWAIGVLGSEVAQQKTCAVSVTEHAADWPTEMDCGTEPVGGFGLLMNRQSRSQQVIWWSLPIAHPLLCNVSKSVKTSPMGAFEFWARCVPFQQTSLFRRSRPHDGVPILILVRGLTDGIGRGSSGGSVIGCWKRCLSLSTRLGSGVTVAFGEREGVGAGVGVSIRFGVDVGFVAILVVTTAPIVWSVGFVVSSAVTAVGWISVGMGVVEGVTLWWLVVQPTVVMVMMRATMASPSHRAWWLRGRLGLASRMLRSGIVSP